MRQDNITAALERVERALSEAKSRQPRFAPDPDRFFASVYGWVDSGLDAPPYQADSRTRDRWLSAFWPREPHLAGVVNSVVGIDKNRNWSLTGGRTSVRRYEAVLRSSLAAPDLGGWRNFFSAQSLSYYTSDLGAVAEIGRDGEDGPLRTLWHLDPARCRLTGKPEAPLQYDNTRDPWRLGDYFRVPSLPSADETMHGLGFCAVSRCFELAALMVAVYTHQKEKLLARAPKGLLLLQGISESQWVDAMAAREAPLSQREQDYFGGVAVLATEGLDKPEARLVALSELPDGFDAETFTNLLMYGYALAFGYDATEFWPVQFGALGRGRETEIQHRKATGKGGHDFISGYQEHLQDLLPESLFFEFEERDAEGELRDAEISAAWADVANAMYQAGMGTLDRDEARSILADRGVIPAEWAETADENAWVDAEGLERARLLDNARVRRAIERTPDEPIVRYTWPMGRERVLWRSGAEALARRSHPVARADVLYADGEVTITDADVDRAIARARETMGEEYASLLDNTPYTAAELDALEDV